MTIEDPIEVLHPDKKSIINQREVGQDTTDFLGALKRALRQDPDVILIGEMRDPETVWAALSAAETGHLVFSTLHTMGAAETINRVIDFFPPYQQQQVRMSLAGALKGIVSQRLVQRSDRDGRVPAMEVLVSTGRVFDKIADSTQTHELEEIIADGEYYGMQTFDQSLLHLYADGVVSRRDALSTASNPHDLRLKMEHYELHTEQEAPAARPSPTRPDRASARRLRAAARDAPGLLASARSSLRLGAAGHRVLRVGRPTRRGSQWRLMSVPPRLAPLLAPDAPVQRVARALVDAGHECYLVGGSVRDALIDDVPVEFDFATDARPERIEALLAPMADHVWLQGKRFGTVGAQVRGRAVRGHHLPGRGVPARLPQARGVLRRLDRAGPLAAGLHRQRDGARASRTPCSSTRTTARPTSRPDGCAPRSPRRCRSPTTRCACCAAARFVARFGFVPDPELVAAVEALGERLDIVSVERIRDELSKLLVVQDPSAGLWFLASTRLADHFLPELNQMELEQDPIHHHKDVLAHTIAVVAKTSPDLVLRLAALMHDVGKPKTRSFERGRADVPPPRGGGRAHDPGPAHRVAVPDRGRGRR